MNEQLLALLAAVATLLVFVVGLLVLIARFYQRAPVGSAIIVSSAGRAPFVAMKGTLVYPIVNRMEIIDLTAKVVRVKRAAGDALLTKDDVRVDVDASFTVRVEQTSESILKVAATFGCAKLSDPAALDAHLRPTFASALATVVRDVAHDELLSRREELQDKLLVVASASLPDGFLLDGVAVERSERTAADSAGPFR